MSPSRVYNSGKCFARDKIKDEDNYVADDADDYEEEEEEEEEEKCTKFESAEYDYYQLCYQQDFEEACEIKELEDQQLSKNNISNITFNAQGEAEFIFLMYQ